MLTTSIYLSTVLLLTTPSFGLPSDPTQLDSTETNYTLPEPGVCGVSMADRILGGTKTELNAYPWTALLLTKVAFSSRVNFGCGGSLISDRFVLTAAHCFRALPFYVKVTKVRLGEWDLETEEDCDDNGLCADKAIDVEVGSYVVHENYDSVDIHNDVALIKLAHPVNFTEFISPVCLPLTEELVRKSDSNRRFTAIGWGTTEKGSEKPGVYGSRYKLEVDLPGVDLKTCRRRYYETLDSEMCAGGEAGKDSCQGDSGGGLVAAEDDGYWYQYGVVSWSYDCGIKGLPGIYARVSSFTDWIKENMK